MVASSSKFRLRSEKLRAKARKVTRQTIEKRKTEREAKRKAHLEKMAAGSAKAAAATGGPKPGQGKARKILSKWTVVSRKKPAAVAKTRKSKDKADSSNARVGAKDMKKAAAALRDAAEKAESKAKGKKPGLLPGWGQGFD
eukprot:Hpha_TRINITY_DN5484_c0_g1::TRINITY_DN5484_c0_g1_i1::g.192461::m.192461